MPAADKTYYEDEWTLVTSSRVLLKHPVRTLLVHELRDPRLDIETARPALPDGLMMRLEWWFTGGVTSRLDLVTVQHDGERVEVDSCIAFDGAERYKADYSPWLGSDVHKTRLKQLGELCAALGDAITDSARTRGRPGVCEA